MAVILRRGDGATKEYPLVAPLVKGHQPAKCGALDCEHLDCAMEYAQNARESYQLIIVVMAILALCMALVLLFLLPWLDIDSFGPYDPVRIAFAISIALNVIMIFYYIRLMRISKDNLRELQEFAARGTVWGMPARQVFRGGGTGESPPGR